MSSTFYFTSMLPELEMTWRRESRVNSAPGNFSWKPELALSYCDRVYEPSLHQPSAKSHSNIYLTLLQIYLNPQKTTKNFEKRITNLVSTPSSGLPRIGAVVLAKTKASRLSRKIAEIEGAEDVRISPSSTDSGRSDGDADDLNEEAGSTIMLDEVLDLLSRRWDRINGAQALKLLPRDTKLQNVLPFLGPLPNGTTLVHFV